MMSKVTRYSSRDLKWLHEVEAIACDDDGELTTYEVEDFGDFYDCDTTALHHIDAFLDTHSPRNLNLKNFVLVDILKPIEFTLQSGVRDIAKDETVNTLRQKKAIFIVTQVLPRVYQHPNFESVSTMISYIVTGLLMMISELHSTHKRRDETDLDGLLAHFRAKDFLAAIALKIWSICLYEKGIPLVPDQTIPYLRQLAMLDGLDISWKYAGDWGRILSLLEERHGDLQRISSDKALVESTNIIKSARNSIRCQILQFGRRLQHDGTTTDNDTSMYRYYPKCSAYLCHEIETPDRPHRLRCYRCHYYHWCSPACQEQSEDLAGHHDLFCTASPEERRDEIRRQMQEYLNIPFVGQEDEEIQCHACGIRKIHSKKMNRCSKCKAVHYCSKACQKWDWSNGKHKMKCESPIFEQECPVAKSSRSTDTASTVASSIQ